MITIIKKGSDFIFKIGSFSVVNQTGKFEVYFSGFRFICNISDRAYDFEVSFFVDWYRQELAISEDPPFIRLDFSEFLTFNYNHIFTLSITPEYL